MPRHLQVLPVHAWTSRRRTVLVGAGLGAVTAVLAACSSYGKKPAAEQSSPATSESAPDGGPGSGAAAQPLTTTAEVPVGSGVIVDDVVVTQPAAGDYKGFSAVCPHAGCTVSEVVDGTIVCPCHGSKFNLDGSVAKGPATKPLDVQAISVEGDSIFLG